MWPRNASLDVLVEVHNIEEMDRALDTDAKINWRKQPQLAHLSRYPLRPQNSLSEEVGADCVLVSESGIQDSPNDVAKVKMWGADAILVGEALMRAEDKTDV